MPSFMVRITYDVRVQDKFETTIEGLQNKYEIGSRCFEDYIEQTAKNIQEMSEKGFCTCHRMTLEVLREATEEDIKCYPQTVS